VNDADSPLFRAWYQAVMLLRSIYDVCAGTTTGPVCSLPVDLSMSPGEYAARQRSSK